MRLIVQFLNRITPKKLGFYLICFEFSFATLEIPFIFLNKKETSRTLYYKVGNYNLIKVKKTIFNIAVKCSIILIAFTNSCQKEDDSLAEPITESRGMALEPRMEDHTDKEYEASKNSNKLKLNLGSYYISRRYIGNPLPSQISNSCQSHATSYAMNAFWQLKNDANPSFSAGTNGRPLNWQRSPYFIYHHQPIFAYWTAYTGLDVAKTRGCTHYGVMPGTPNLSTFVKDLTFGISNWQEMLTKATILKIKNWYFVNGSNTWSTPISPGSWIWWTSYLDQLQIKLAIKSNRPVLVRFALKDGAPNNGLPTTKNWPGLPPTDPVFNEPHRNNTSLTKWHVVLIVGFDDDKQLFYCQNSWGHGATGVANGMNGMGGFYMTYNTLKYRADQATYIYD